MQIINGRTGWLEVICGPMFSGKSEELIKRLRRAQIARRRVQIFKHGIDARYDATSIVSHSQQSLPGVAIENIEDILDLVDDRTELVAIDEGQFFSPEILTVTNKLANQGKRVIVQVWTWIIWAIPSAPCPSSCARPSTSPSSWPFA
jgi:thymidine kinase